uniref:Mas-related G-protein coupled receptor member H-like n=1 Tax=Pogona vitticeps TaxID=103695 RepID=A0ABM5GCW0_9SAUR
MPAHNTTLSLPSTYTVGWEYNLSSSPNATILTVSDGDDITDLLTLIIMVLSPAIWISGLVGNGIVIWFLGFIIRRNPITTYVLNLAVADSGVLLFFMLFLSFFFLEEVKLYPLFFLLFFFTHSTSLYLLTAISAERCVSVLFPIWYRCRRSKHQSAAVCVLIWAVYFLLNVIQIFVLAGGSTEEDRILENVTLLMMVLIINFLFCTPLMVICSITLFIRVCCNLHRRQHRKLSVAILLALFFFIIFNVPLSALITISTFHSEDLSGLLWLGLVFITINSSINPLIYFVVGRRKRKNPSRENFAVALRTVFTDKADNKEDENEVDFQMQRRQPSPK